jgi:T-complex protein 1 subunit delta
MATQAASPAASSTPSGATIRQYDDKTEKQKDVRTSNIIAAKAVANVIRTSLGPKGMDKMISSPTGEVTITNDGATILKQLNVAHPAAKLLVELSHAQDVEAGDGTTTVVVLAGSFLNACSQLLEKGIHPMIISESFLKAEKKANEVLQNMATPINLGDRESLLKSAMTSLNSKVVSQYSSLLGPIAVDAVLRVIDPATATNVDLRDIKTVKKVGGTIDDTELVNGIVFTQKASHSAGGPSRVANAKIGLIQFCLSPPKTNMESNVVITDYTQMDRFLKEEKLYIQNLISKIHKAGCNVLLIQKSILRDAVTDLSLHYLARLKIMVVKDIERDEIEFISKTLNCQPIASIEAFTTDKLGHADLVEEVSTGESKVVKVTGVPSKKTVSVLVRGSNKLVVDEAERSLHDALCVIRSLVKKKSLIAGGGAPEIEASIQLANYAKTLTGAESYCVRAYAEALEVVPYTLAENAGLHPIAIVTELRNKHAQGEKNAGINVRKVSKL